MMTRYQSFGSRTMIQIIIMNNNDLNIVRILLHVLQTMFLKILGNFYPLSKDCYHHMSVIRII